MLFQLVESGRVTVEVNLLPEKHMQLILPNMLESIQRDTPFFFLLGPIRGGGDWQHTACKLVWNRVPDAAIAVPCRWTASHPLYRYRIDGPDDAFTKQTFWERHYLKCAAMEAGRGSIIGWLPRESQTHPRDDGEPYGRDTYGEIGEWRGRLMHNRNLRFVLGAEAGYPGISVIKSNFDDALEWRFKIHKTLEDTVEAALSRALPSE